MTRNERMVLCHVDSLTSNYDSNLLKLFSKPVLEGDSITSTIENKKIAFITRHLLTGESTHSLKLEGEFYDRL